MSSFALFEQLQLARLYDRGLYGEKALLQPGSRFNPPSDYPEISANRVQQSGWSFLEPFGPLISGLQRYLKTLGPRIVGEALLILLQDFIHVMVWSGVPQAAQRERNVWLKKYTLLRPVVMP